MAKKLNLKRLSVEDLSAQQLVTVSGAAATRICVTVRCFTHTTSIDCVSQLVCTTTGE